MGKVSTVKLANTYSILGEKVTVLTLQELTGRDLVATDKAQGENERNLRLLASSARIPFESVLEFTLEDISTAVEALADFLPQPKPAE